MSNTLTIQQGRYKYIGAIDKDNHVNIDLEASTNLLDDQDLFRTVSALQQAQDERAESKIYRIHGTINLISFLNNKPIKWTDIENLISHSGSNDVKSDFELCLGYVAKYEPYPLLGDNYYERRIKVIKTGADIDYLPCGFAKSVYSEPEYNFMLNGDIDLSNIESKGLQSPWPITDLILYLKPKEPFRLQKPDAITDTKELDPNTIFGFVENDPLGTQAILSNNLGIHLRPDKLSGVTDSSWSAFIYPEILTLFRLADMKLTPDNIRLNAGFIRAWIGIEKNPTYKESEVIDSEGLLSAGIVYFNPDSLEFREVYSPKYSLRRTLTIDATIANQTQLTKLGYSYTVKGNLLVLNFGFTYSPFQVVNIRQFSTFIERGTPDDVFGIPNNAIIATDGSGDLLWRDLLDAGYIEPGSGRGVNAPFINGAHYIYSKVAYLVGPDLSNPNSYNAFKATRLLLNTTKFSL